MERTSIDCVCHPLKKIKHNRFPPTIHHCVCTLAGLRFDHVIHQPTHYNHLRAFFGHPNNHPYDIRSLHKASQINPKKTGLQKTHHNQNLKMCALKRDFYHNIHTHLFVSRLFDRKLLLSRNFYKPYPNNASNRLRHTSQSRC